MIHWVDIITSYSAHHIALLYAVPSHHSVSHILVGHPNEVGRRRQRASDLSTDRDLQHWPFSRRSRRKNQNDENCISNAEKVKNYSKRFLPGHWTFLGPGSERDGAEAQKMDNGTVQPTKSYSNSKETGHPINTATSALSRGTLKRRTGKSTIHFNGDFRKTELLFQTLNYENQVSIYAVVTNCCYNFALKKNEKEHILTPVNNRIMDVVEPEEVDMLVSSPNQAQESFMVGKEGSHDPIMRQGLIPKSCHSRKSIPSSTRWRRRVGRHFTSMQRIHLFSSLPTSQTVGTDSSRHNYWTDRRSSHCEHYWRIWSGRPRTGAVNSVWQTGQRTDARCNEAWASE